MPLLTTIALVVSAAQGAAAQTAPIVPPQPPAVTRRLDGLFDDWRGTERTNTQYDKANDALDAPDVTRVTIASDPFDVWMLLEFREPVTLQGLPRPLLIAIDSDGRPQTGATKGPLLGADLALVFSPTAAQAKGNAGIAPTVKREDLGAGNAEKSKGEGTGLLQVLPDGTLGVAIPHERSHIEFAPTHASNRFEIRIPRLPNGIMGMATAARVSCAEEVDGGGVQLREDVQIVRALLAQATIPTEDLGLDVDAAKSAIARAPDSTLRVVSWNAERGRVFEASEGFAAILTLLNPDVVLFQELGAKATGESLAAWMNANVGASGAAPWSALVSGGDLRVGIAARGSLANAAFLDGVKRGSEPNERSVRVHGATLDLDGNAETPPLLLVSLHLKCCGRLGSSEDATRREEAATIREAIWNSIAKAPYAGVVVAGDFNLVGDPAVLEEIGRTLDSDGSNLDVVSAFQLDGVSSATWRSKGAPFVPGRLDYALVSGARVDVRRSFVFDARDLKPATIAAFGLPASAVDEPSDHMPLVLDLHVAPAAPATAEPKKPSEPSAR
ncbi:MAG: endonuclease/exonuclease/phosphatase family protein [Phycisphaerae bacterium]|nr:endonuclease/exonuclease/phosphatase family protein [Phycisphaerae bacterium]